MFIAVASIAGRKMLVLGLQEENIIELKNDKPIYKDFSSNPVIQDLVAWDLVILGPEDTARFMSHKGLDI